MLEKKDKEALTNLKRIVERLNIPILMVGAGARLIIFDRRFNIEGRTTKDWDFAVRLEVFSNELAEAILDFDEAPACLLGKDIKKIFSSLTVETLLQILDSILQQQDSLVSQLIQNVFDEDAWNQTFDRIVSLFEALRSGLNFNRN
jgi:predicted nucleotidyltransferase